MPFMDNLNSAITKMDNWSRKITNKLETENHRKYVWYDYSIVEKAKIQIIKSTGPVIGSFIPGAKGTEGYLNLETELTVQINPSEFRYEHYLDPESIISKLENRAVAPGFNLYSFGDRETSTFAPTLIYDIYDEYNARTANGSLPSDFSLMSKSATSLPTLIKRANENNCFARFIWGDIVKFGLLAGVAVDYTAFSQWGQPLKANATITIIEQNVPLDGGAKNLPVKGVSGFSSVKTAAKRLATLKNNIFR